MFAPPRRATRSMPSKSFATVLQDILVNIQRAHLLVAGRSFEDLQTDFRVSYALVRCLEIISEASRRLPEELKARHPQIDWAAVAAAGNIYRHHYQVVSDEIIWQTVQETWSHSR